MPICGSPRLFAAYRVFHRLPVPRHSPCALCSLTMHCSPLQASAHRDDSCYVFRLIVVSYPLLLIVTLLSNLISQLFLSLFNFQGAIRFVKAFVGMTPKTSGPSSLSALPHFSMGPVAFFLLTFSFSRKKKQVVGTSGLEPPTSRLSGARSNQLSYAPLWWR